MTPSKIIFLNCLLLEVLGSSLCLPKIIYPNLTSKYVFGWLNFFSQFLWPAVISKRVSDLTDPKNTELNCPLHVHVKKLCQVNSIIKDIKLYLTKQVFLFSR